MSRVSRFFSAVLFLGLCLGLRAAEASPAIVLEGDPPDILVRGSEALARAAVPNPESILQVFVAGGGTQAMAGSYEQRNGLIVFHPQFPLVPGVTYQARFALGGETASADISLPKPNLQPTARVEAIYPSQSVLPENLLKFYIHFSASMSKGGAFNRIHLIDENGAEAPDAFLKLEEELWDPEHRRLTILFDPGRIKRDLVPNRDMGLPLKPGHSYSFIVDANWPDAHGARLASGFIKNFSVVAADRTPLSTATWRIASPKAGTRAPVTIDFPESIDEAMLQRVIEIADAQGRNVAGAVSIARNETNWSFVPAESWRAEKYSLNVPGMLEDVAGNKIDRDFDVDVTENAGKPVMQKSYALPFTPAP